LPNTSRAFIQTSVGRIHYASAGEGDPVLLLHQSPRSWDEFRDVIPLLAERFRVLAMDTIGFGDSDKPSGPASVEGYGRGVIAFLDAMSIERTTLVGHHTGGVIAVEVAATRPERVDRLVLSGTTCVDEEGRRIAAQWPPIDLVEVTPDGRHLMELWQRRMPYYPPDRPDLLHRLVLDCLRVIDRVEDGHVAVDTYHMEDRLPLIVAPTLLMCGVDDWAAFPDLPRLKKYLPDATVIEVPDAGVPLPDHRPEVFARIVTEFLTAPEPGTAAATAPGTAAATAPGTAAATAPGTARHGTD
jgi:pimeloyl-ACP methyl ester carboxylesterase